MNELNELVNLMDKWVKPTVKILCCSKVYIKWYLAVAFMLKSAENSKNPQV